MAGHHDPIRNTEIPCWYRAATLLLSLSLLAFFSPPAPAAGDPLRLSVSLTPLSLPLFVAESQGYWTAAGVDVRVEEVIGGHRSLQQLLDGAADLATCSEAVVMFNSFARNDFAILATFVSSDDDIRLVTRTRTGIASLGDLAGKRVATVIGSASHYYLDASLILNGVDPAEVLMEEFQPETMIEALETGRIDAIAIWEPYAFEAQTAIADARVLPTTHVYLETFNLVASKPILAGRGEDLVKFLRGLERAQQLIASDAQEAQRILRQRLHLDQSFIDSIWDRYQYRLTLSQSLLTTLEGEARWALEAGHATAAQSPNYLDFIDSAPLRILDPEAVSLTE